MSVLGRIARIIRANVEELISRREPLTSGGHQREGQQERHEPSDSRQEESRRPSSPEADLLAKYYANLEVPYGSDFPTVTAAWKRLLKRYHPDRHSTDPQKQQIANQLVQELNRAYDYLKHYLEHQKR